MADDLLNLLGGALGTTPPSYMEGLLGTQATEDLQKRSIGTGLANALIGYLAMPKNQNLGLGRILAGAAQSGITGAQGVYSGALEDYQTKAKIDEMKRNKLIQDRELKKQLQVEALTPQLFQTTPAQYRDVDGQPYFIPAPTAEGATSPNYGLQSVVPEPTRELVSPARTTLNMDVAQQIAALSKDPLAAYKNIAETIPAMRKAGMVQTAGQQDNPFLTWATTATSPQVQKLASQYANSYTNGTIDAETADKRIADLAKAEESFVGRTESASARKAEADRQYELRQMLAQGQIDQRQFQQEIARGNLALREQLAAQKSQKVLPPMAFKQEGERLESALNNVNLANDIDTQIANIGNSGVKFNTLNNVRYATQSNLPNPDAATLGYLEYQRFATKLINDTLRLNKGVQTDADFIRAKQELSSAKSNADVIRALRSMQDVNLRYARNANELIVKSRNTAGLTEDRGYPAPEKIEIPTFPPVVYSTNDAAFKALPKDAIFIDGTTGKRKYK